MASVAHPHSSTDRSRLVSVGPFVSSRTWGSVPVHLAGRVEGLCLRWEVKDVRTNVSFMYNQTTCRVESGRECIG